MKGVKHDGRKGTRLCPTIDNTAKCKGRDRAWPAGNPGSDCERENNHGSPTACPSVYPTACPTACPTAYPNKLGGAKWRETKVKNDADKDSYKDAYQDAEEKPPRGEEPNHDVVESFIGIDHQNLPFVKSNFASRINSKNVVPIIDLFIHNLFFHLKSIGKNIDNFYLRFRKVVYPFHFPFRNCDVCDECLLNENKRRRSSGRSSSRSSSNGRRGVMGKRWCAHGPQQQHNWGRKNRSEFLPQILNAWCERVKCLINIYNKNRKKQKVKEYLVRGGREERDSEEDNFLFDQRSRYDMNECAKGLVESIILDEDRWKKLKQVSFFPTGKKQQFVKNKSDYVTHQREDQFLPDLCRQKGELWNEDITDLYLINLVKRKIEDYIKNVQVKKFWDVINVQSLANFDYRHAGGGASSKWLAASSKWVSVKGATATSRQMAPPKISIYPEPIYDYIQIVKKTKCKKEGKNSQVEKETDKVKIQGVNGSNTREVDKGKADKEFIMKDLFNNTIKNYESNEVQIFLSNYDNVFLKSIGRFYLLLNFSIEILAILYEDLDLYSLHIFSLYSYLGQCGAGGVGRQTDWQSSNLAAGRTWGSCDQKQTFLTSANELLCSLSPTQRRLDAAVFFLLRIFLKSKHGAPSMGVTANCGEPICSGPQLSGSLADEIIHNLRVEKYKEIMKEVIKLTKYMIEKKIHLQKPVVKYLLAVYKKYKQKVHAMQNNNRGNRRRRTTSNSKHVKMLRRNFLFHSMNFYSFEFFTRKDLRVNLGGSHKWRSKRKVLRIPGHSNRRDSVGKWRTCLLRSVGTSSRGNNILAVGSHAEGVVVPRVNGTRLRRARRVRHLRALRLRLYAYFRLARQMGAGPAAGSKTKGKTSKKSTARKKSERSRKCKSRSGGTCRDRKFSSGCQPDDAPRQGEEHLFILSLYKSNLVKSLNVERIRRKVRALVRSKNALYKKVVQKARERCGRDERGEVVTRDKYYNIVVEVLGIIKRQDEEIRSNLFGMIQGVNEQLNLFYANICRCAPAESWEQRNVELVMQQRLGALRGEDGDSVWLSRQDRGNVEEGGNATEGGESADESVEAMEAVGDEVCSDACNGTHPVREKMARLRPSRSGKRPQRRPAQKGTGSHGRGHERRCTKCECTLDKHLLDRKEKMQSRFYNVKNYYKEKRHRINYLSYDVSILKEYLCAYVKKFFADVILLFEYFFCVLNANLGLGCGDEGGGEKKEDLLCEWFSLSSVDNFNNGGASHQATRFAQATRFTQANRFTQRKHTREYENYLLLNKLKYFAKNDIIQFMSKSIGCVQDEVLVKIGSVKKAFHLLHALMKTQRSNNELFIYKLLLSFVFKYGEYCQGKEMKKGESTGNGSSFSQKYASEYELEKCFLKQKKRKKFLSQFGLDYMNIPHHVTSFLKHIIQGYKMDHTGGKVTRVNDNAMDVYTSCLYNMASCGKDDTNVNCVLQKILKKKKKEFCPPQNKGKIYAAKDTHKEEDHHLLLSHLSSLYEIIHESNLEEYGNLRIFITMEKRKKINRKRKLNCDEVFLNANMNGGHNHVVRKEIKKYSIHFVDDNKYVFPYICNTFDWGGATGSFRPSRPSALASWPPLADSSDSCAACDPPLDYEITQLNNNFKFFHFINPGREYSFRNSILNFVYGYPLVCVRKDLEEGVSPYHVGLRNGAKSATHVDGISPHVDVRNGDRSATHVEGSKELTKKLFRRRKRKELMRHLSSVDISNNIPLKYMHLSVIGDIFRNLKLEHVLTEAIKKLYEEMLQTIQKKFLQSNNTHHLANVVTCFLLFFTSFLDILLGVRDNNYINLTHHGDFNIFNNFNGPLFKKQKKKRGEESSCKGHIKGGKKKNNKKSYVYMHNRYSRRSTYLWLLWRERQNEMGSQVEHIYVRPKGETTMGVVPGGRLVSLMSNYRDFNFSFLNNAKCVHEYKGKKQYLFVTDGGGAPEEERTVEKEAAQKEEAAGEERTLLFRHTNVSVHSVEDNITCEDSPPFLTRANFADVVTWGDMHVGWTSNFELIEGKSTTSPSLVERIRLALTILTGYLKETLNMKKHCLLEALQNFKQCKSGLEDIKFIYHLNYLLDLDTKEKKVPDLVIFKKVYYLLMEALFGGAAHTLPEGKTNEKQLPCVVPPTVDAERVVSFIFNFVKITKMIKMTRKEKMKSIFKFLQMYVEKSADFYESIFNRLFLFIYEDTKEENRRFLRRHLDSYFNGKKITFHILSHILRSLPAGGHQRQKRQLFRNQPWHHPAQQRSVLPDEEPAPLLGLIPRFKDEQMEDGPTAEPPSACRLPPRQHQTHQRNSKKKMKFSSVNEEIFKKTFRMGRSIYSSDSCDSTKRSIFRVKRVESRNYLAYEREKANYFFPDSEKKTSSLKASKGSVENDSVAGRDKGKGPNVLSCGSSSLVTSHRRDEVQGEEEDGGGISIRDHSTRKGKKRGEQLSADILSEQLWNDGLWDETKSFSTSLCTNEEVSIATKKGITKGARDFTQSEENPRRKESLESYSSSECLQYVNNLCLQYGEKRWKGQKQKKKKKKKREHF
ncbi:hypothetical protein AK88_00358 [Plasmodium fragile]|uniref:Uncharacterized protein n=1 Tax=Plasmodium fragile TaxID=5857 RepID=A0A0D9QSS7_PLAFR|nr:uncharacterized protein AK88_00358 [Plasmodium fragile]KJP89902.1 hypothetical protein AK88_00358 [Plasmodium fragile]